MCVLRNAAMFFADLGFPIVACVPHSLRIMPAFCLRDATRQKEVIRQWWTRWPEANIGIRTDDIIVFDLATKAEVLKLGKLNPPTLKMPGGGYQVFFSRLGCEPLPWGPGIHSGPRDYVVVGPSCVARGRIRWIVPMTLLERLPTYAALETLLREQEYVCAKT